MVIEQKLRVHKPFREKIPRNQRRLLAFLCPKCHSWLYLTRDLEEDRIDLSTGIQYRRFVCFDCHEVFEFQGHRGIHFPRIGVIRLSRRVHIQIPPELKELIAFKKQIEKILRMKV